jgi:hypothetical protein
MEQEIRKKVKNIKPQIINVSVGMKYEKSLMWITFT